MADAVEEQMQQPVWDGQVDEDGLPHGQGTLIYPAPPPEPDEDTKPGDQYVGSMNHGNREGKGKYIWTSIGASFEGDYSNNVKHGQGVLIVPDKGRYEGSFAQDQLEGEGTYYYLNGDIYSGSWKANKKHGQGIYYFKAQHCQYVGSWHEGSFVEGKWVYNDGSMFTGSFNEVAANAGSEEQALVSQNLVAQQVLAPQLAAAQQQPQQAQQQQQPPSEQSTQQQQQQQSQQQRPPQPQQRQQQQQQQQQAAQAIPQTSQQPVYVLQNADGQYYFASSGLLQPGFFAADGTWQGGEISTAQLAGLSGVPGEATSGPMQ